MSVCSKGEKEPWDAALVIRPPRISLSARPGEAQTDRGEMRVGSGEIRRTTVDVQSWSQVNLPGAKPGGAKAGCELAAIVREVFLALRQEQLGTRGVCMRMLQLAKVRAPSSSHADVLSEESRRVQRARVASVSLAEHK